MDMTNQFNTQLSPREEKAYLAWLATLPKQQQNTYDYDMRGAYKAGAGASGDGHFTDQFKKPNHPTFSVESQYSGSIAPDGRVYQGGVWGDGTYTPSAAMLGYTHNPEELAAYMAKVEPDTKLVLPAPYQQMPKSPVKGPIPPDMLFGPSLTL